MAQKINAKQQISTTSRKVGWDYVNITVAGTTQAKDFTFPTPFATAPTCVIVTPLGWTTGTVTGIDSFTGNYGNTFGFSYHVRNITATGFRIELTANANFGVSKSGFTWIAEA